jgi:hypothetical protein
MPAPTHGDAEPTMAGQEAWHGPAASHGNQTHGTGGSPSSECYSTSLTRTLEAAQALTRRTLLKATVAGSVAAVGPW